MKTIPPAVLDLLKQEWKPSDGSSFDELICDKDRRRHPSYYIHSDDHEDNGVSAFTSKEVKALVDAGVLDDFAKRHPTSTAVNEHAEHALSEFCSEVYDAWRKLQARLRSI